MACKRYKSNNEDPSRPKNNMQKKNQLFTITWVIESNKQFSVSNQTLVYPKLKLRESNPLIQQDNTCKRNHIEWKGAMFHQNTSMCRYKATTWIHSHESNFNLMPPYALQHFFQQHFPQCIITRCNKAISCKNIKLEDTEDLFGNIFKTIFRKQFLLMICLLLFLRIKKIYGRTCLTTRNRKQFLVLKKI